MDIWELYAWVKNGRKRGDIIKSLAVPMTPTQLIGEHKLHSNSVTRIIRDLRNKNLIEFIELKGKQKTYMLTKKGEIACQMLHVFEKRPATRRDLIKLLKLHHKLVTHMTKSLVQIGLITIFKTRNPARKFCKLTKEGEAVREKLEKD